MYRLVFLLMLVALAGCNEVKNGFRPVMTLDQIKSNPAIVKYEGEPTIRDGATNASAEIDNMKRDGWLLLGQSVFVGDLTMDQQIMALAKEYKAELVTRHLLKSTVSTVPVPISTGTGTIFTPMTTGSNTYGISLWARAQPGLGLYWRDITQEEALKRGDANGAVITLVVRGGGGDKAGIREGDVIISVGGKDIVNAIDMLVTYRKATITQIDFRLVRDGQPQTITVTKDVPVDPVAEGNKS